MLDNEPGAFFLERDFHQNESNMRFSGCKTVINGVAYIGATPFITIPRLENLIFDSF